MNFNDSVCQVGFDTHQVSLGKTPVKFNLTLFMSETSGQWLKRVRIERGYTQTELAERSRVSKNYVSLLEADKVTQPRLRQLDKIALALSLPKEYVRAKFSGINQPSQPRTYTELLQALELLGIEIDWALINKNLENYTEADFAELLERIKFDTDFSVRRKAK